MGLRTPRGIITGPYGNSKSRILETKDKLSIINNAAPDQLDGSVFFFCRNCHGTGEILTDEGKRLLEFVRFWLNRIINLIN